MIEAQQAVQASAALIPSEMQLRLEGTSSLSDEDRKEIVAITLKSLDSFHEVKT